MTYSPQERVFLAISAAVLYLSGSVVYAMDAEETAQAAAVADGASTAVVLAAGAIESNPIVNSVGLLPITAVKFAIPYMVRDAEPATRKAVLVSASGIYGGAAVNNLLLLVGAGPVAIVGGIVAGIWFGFNTADKVDAEYAAIAARAQAVAAAEVQP